MAKAKTKPEVIMVTNSCGCVFCDLDLEPYLAAKGVSDPRLYWHDTKHGSVKCTNPQNQPST